MAIKLPDPGNGIPEQKTGNDEWTNMKIVRDNFADQAHAASRLVGMQRGQIAPVEDIASAFGRPIGVKKTGGTTLNLPVGDCSFLRASDINQGENIPATGSWVHVLTTSVNETGAYGRQVAFGINNTDTFARISSLEGNFANSKWDKFYTSGNTTVDSNKNIKQSSPVVRVFSDHLDKIHEANDLPIKYTRNGVGDYTIEGTTGLRENDWQIIIPEDDHRNQLIAFTIEDDNGTIRLKTYKRTFNMTTFMFEPDLNTPLDIPEGRWVDLHFNDLPQEQLDEPVI